MLLAAAGHAVWAQQSVPTAAAAPPVATETVLPGSSSAPAVRPFEAAMAKARSVPPSWRKVTVRFTNEKPVLGLPLDSHRSRQRCANDGTVFFDVTAESDAQPAPLLYGVSRNGEVKHVLRKLPIDYNDVSVRDFFAGQGTLVTLLQAEKRDGPDMRPREVDYFLSTSDHDGDLPNLIPLDVRFKPLKVASFGSGDFMVLGWDEGNLLPELALLKGDGTIRRFVDLDDHKPRADPQKEAARERVTLEELQDAVLVPYGSEVMVTYPGTAKPVLVVGAGGQSRSIPIALPGGYVLHDVLVSEAPWSLVLRAQEPRDPKAKDDEGKVPQPRMFEVDSNHGNLIREYVIDNKPLISEVTCAAKNSLTAIFYDAVDGDGKAVPNAGAGVTAADDATDASKRLVVATVRQ
jgi:hypothetical protein